MQRLWAGLSGVALVSVIVVAVVFLSPEIGTKTAMVHPTRADAALAHPMGELRDRSDVGEQHYRQGRYPEAIAYWIEAAAGGNGYAAHRLGVEYMDGKPGVVDRDYAKARQYHIQAAKLGFALSMFDLGSMNEYGFGVDKSLPEAAKWYRHSADYGLAQGQYNFATMLESGDGVPPDAVEALKYYILGARGGFTGVPFNARNNKIDQSAPTPANALEARLTREQTVEGHRRADAFQAASGPLAAE